MDGPQYATNYYILLLLTVKPSGRQKRYWATNIRTIPDQPEMAKLLLPGTRYHIEIYRKSDILDDVFLVIFRLKY